MDDYAGGYQATSYLAALGHRRIAFVSAPSELGSVQERYRGNLDALARRESTRLARSVWPASSPNSSG
jgi:DNA-binding LacI/PurR family transcriptional regulator